LGTVFLAGLIGSLADSILGATLQVIYVCAACGRETEKHPTHSCGGQTEKLRGLHWMSNDWVNLGCTLSAALFSMLLYFLL
jgi:uncharacterized membrane protein